jgi:MFS family permease
VRANVDPVAARRARVALTATLAIQVYASLAATAGAVLAPVIAPDFGLSPNLVGVFTGLVYAGSMSASLVAGALIARRGPIRLSQICVLVCAAGVALLPIAAALPVALLLLVVAPIVIGLGYGPITPASSDVLSRTAHPARMALTFSIKQTGVPAGAALGGALLPALALGFGWKPALAGIAALGVLVALAAQITRSDLDRHRERDRQFTLASVLKPLRSVLESPELRGLAVLSFFYAATQVSLTSYLVVYTAESLGRSLVTAGLALSVATLGGIVGRVLWGAVADRYIEPRRLLMLLGVVAGLCAFATAAYPAGWPIAPLFAVVTLFGATAIGWNGVQLAEVARHAPSGEAGAITGAAAFVGFSGVVIGPPLFGALAALTGSYRAGFVAVGLAALASGVWFWRRGRDKRRQPGERRGDGA